MFEHKGHTFRTEVFIRIGGRSDKPYFMQLDLSCTHEGIVRTKTILSYHKTAEDARGQIEPLERAGADELCRIFKEENVTWFLDVQLPIASVHLEEASARVRLWGGCSLYFSVARKEWEVLDNTEEGEPVEFRFQSDRLVQELKDYLVRQDSASSLAPATITTFTGG